MRINANAVLAGDVVRGIGLVVDYSEPASDFNWSLIGHYTYRDPESGEVQPTGNQSLTMANDHRVNVRRSDENFLADRIRWAQEAIDRFRDAPLEADGAFTTLVYNLRGVANAPRGRFVLDDQIVDYLLHNPQFNLESFEDVATAEGLVHDLDQIVTGDDDMLVLADEEPEAEGYTPIATFFKE